MGYWEDVSKTLGMGNVCYLRGRDVVEVAAIRLGLDGAAFWLHRVNWKEWKCRKG